MSDPLAAASLVAEVFTWIGLLVGPILLIPGFIRLLWSSQWKQHRGVVTGSTEDGVVYRWFGAGQVHEAEGRPGKGRTPAEGDAVIVYAPASAPDRGRIDPVDHLGRTLRTAGWMFTALGLVAALVSLLLLFV